MAREYDIEFAILEWKLMDVAAYSPYPARGDARHGSLGNVESEHSACSVRSGKSGEEGACTTADVQNRGVSGHWGERKSGRLDIVGRFTVLQVDTLPHGKSVHGPVFIELQTRPPALTS